MLFRTATTAIVLAMATTALAQSAPSAPPAPAATPAVAAATAATAQAPAASGEAEGYNYNANGRRDPFVSLLRRGSEVQGAPAGARAPGLAGLGAGEVALKGTMQGRDGYLAMLLGADTKTYIVRPGDRLLDGTIRAITADAVVIVQQVNDPLSLQKQREVRKLLRQTEEAK